MSPNFCSLEIVDMKHDKLYSGQQEGGHHREADNGVAGLVEVGNLEAVAHVPGQVPAPVEEVEGDGPGQSELCQENDWCSEVEVLDHAQPDRKGALLIKKTLHIRNR